MGSKVVKFIIGQDFTTTTAIFTIFMLVIVWVGVSS